MPNLSKNMMELIMELVYAMHVVLMPCMLFLLFLWHVVLMPTQTQKKAWHVAYAKHFSCSSFFHLFAALMADIL